ncbi:MAG: hypothetical protein M1379_12525 [Firmicutes bacterium]|nr:hypothetical protein [Bacillota bacterium]
MKLNRVRVVTVGIAVSMVMLLVTGAAGVGLAADPRKPVIIRMPEIYIDNDMDGWSQGVGDIHVQYKFKSYDGGGQGVDGIDYGEWQIGHNTTIYPNKELKVYVPLYDDLVVCLYDDDPGSTGRGTGDTTGSDDIIENVEITDFVSAPGLYTLNADTADGGYIKMGMVDDAANQPGYSDYSWVKYSPHVVQPDVDRSGDNKVLAVIYDPPANNTITYYLVFQDEDHPTLDASYDAIRKQDWRRLEDVEWVKVHYDAVGVDWVQIKYGGAQDYYVSTPDDSDIRYFYRSNNEIQFNGTHPRIYVATWNHLFDVKARNDVTWSWGGTYNLLLIDGSTINKDYLTIPVP